jgi:ferredoxin-type protein NapF
MNIKPNHIRWIVFAFAVILSLPFFPEPISGIYLWISPYIVLISIFNGKSLVWLHLLGLVTLVLLLFRKRWICRYACPAGIVCDLSSKLGRKSRPRLKIPINRYLAVFALVLAIFGAPFLIVADPLNLFYMAFEGFRTGLGLHAVIKLSGVIFLILFSLLFPHLFCSSVCPLGGLQLLLSDLKKIPARQHFKPETNSESRRLFLSGFAGILGGLFTPRLFRNRTDKVIRPPFSLPEARLNMACARCGNCSSVCPTGIISQSVDISQPDRLLTPVVSFSDAYCLPECNACGMVCPSGAIRDFSSDEKKSHVMGIAVIQLDQCYLKEGRECDLCRVYCDYQAIEISATGSGTLRLPRILEKQCVGCGACQVVCPPQAIEITTCNK